MVMAIKSQKKLTKNTTMYFKSRHTSYTTYEKERGSLIIPSGNVTFWILNWFLKIVPQHWSMLKLLLYQLSKYLPEVTGHSVFFTRIFPL